MAKIADDKLTLIRKWYASGLSARDIAKRLRISLDAVYYFLRKHSIERRSPRANNALLFARKKPSFEVRKKLSPKEERLKTIGTMLYWAEGSQWPGEVIVDFANSNTDMVSLFILFLRKICGIKESKLRAYIYCYSNQRPRDLIRYWSRITKIPAKRFTKPYVRRDFKPEKMGRMMHGLIHIRYYDKKLLLQIRSWIVHYSKLF